MVTLSRNKSSSPNQNITDDSSNSAETKSHNYEPKRRKQSTLESCLERSLSFEVTYSQSLIQQEVFLVVTVHFIVTIKEKNLSAIQSINLCAQKLSQSHTSQYITKTWNDICDEFAIDRSKIISITTDGGANMVAAVRLFLGKDHRIPCLAHCLNLIFDGVLKEILAFSALS
ncbi:hypothetical protein KQX54_014020 [Cotesia glomerata]|uniref:DUF659 domain-containing protein n=1 Tax=Cotesia glomerata TaxID=32391 RepID=A0AAV7II14_COTGL|nr:hypothetical protein KQX54_014020 [Cotesia glomerata]